MTKIAPNEIDHFLSRVRRGLSGLPADIRADVVAELRSHLEDKNEQGQLDLAREFGTPEAYANRFISEQRLSDAINRGTTIPLVTALLGAAQATVFVLFVILPLVTVELISLMSVAIGLAKPFDPGQIGLFMQSNGDFGSLGWIQNVNSMHEVLGYSAIPIFILGGLMVFWVVNRLLLTLARGALAKLRTGIHALI